MRTRLLQEIHEDIQAEKNNERQRRDEALRVALNDKKFAELDAQVRELTSKLLQRGLSKKDADDLVKRHKTASEARNAFFDKLYTPKQSQYVEARLQKKVRELNPVLCSFPNTVDHPTLAKFAKNFPKVEKQNLVLMGGTGTGKTYASLVTANALVDRGFVVMYTTTVNLIQQFRDLSDFLECDLLVIDDLGTEPVIKNISEETLYTVINERLLNGRPVVFSTNLNPQELVGRYDQRLVSRVLSNLTTKIIDFGKEDKRFKS